jgi:outer membrane protein assembly factor BamB
MKTHRLVLLGVALWSLSSPAALAQAPWSTYRGNARRTGNTDGIAGPSAPAVLWAVKSQQHFIAAPVPWNDRVLLAGLGAFNVPTLHCLLADPKASPRTAWAKTTPYLKLPTVSSPAVAEGKLIFGDGMHQTDGALLHCLQAEKGLPLWQLPLPGRLVHLEGSPTVAQGKVYIGGGAAGVLCVFLDRVTLDGKEQDLNAILKLQETKWKELLARYEAQKKKDPDFAVPPSDDELPRPAPVKAWQQGAEKWHVDAPVAVAGDRVLAASAYLDLEKLGDRAVYCLDAATGDVRWRTAVKLNPWGGPTVAGGTVVFGGSTIGYDLKVLKGARGEVTALDLATGKERWRKETAGGVVSCVAVADGLAIASATDGKVRAFDLATGERRWIYDAKTPLFAPVGIAAGTVYAGDLQGVVHALALADGTPRWTIDLATDAKVGTPGMIYAGPTIHGGRVFVATCNLEGPHANQATAVVCIGTK